MFESEANGRLWSQVCQRMSKGPLCGQCCEYGLSTAEDDCQNTDKFVASSIESCTKAVHHTPILTAVADV